MSRFGKSTLLENSFFKSSKNLNPIILKGWKNLLKFERISRRIEQTLSLASHSFSIRLLLNWVTIWLSSFWNQDVIAWQLRLVNQRFVFQERFYSPIHSHSNKVTERKQGIDWCINRFLPRMFYRVIFEQLAKKELLSQGFFFCWCKR